MDDSKERGHDTYYKNGIHYYSDTNEPTAGNRRKCAHCKAADLASGHDSCIGELSGIMNACCGHGVEEEAYVQFNGACKLSGSAALLYIEAKK